MAGVALHLSLDDAAFRAGLAHLHNMDMHGVFDEIGRYLVDQVTQRLAQQVDIKGQPLKPSRRAREEGGKTLIDKGHLRDSYTYNVFADGRGVEVGSDAIYAAIHHVGGQAGRHHAVRLPARPVLGVDDEDRQEIDAIVFHAVQNHLNQALRP